MFIVLKNVNKCYLILFMSFNLFAAGDSLFASTHTFNAKDILLKELQ